MSKKKKKNKFRPLVDAPTLTVETETATEPTPIEENAEIDTPAEDVAPIAEIPAVEASPIAEEVPAEEAPVAEEEPIAEDTPCEEVPAEEEPIAEETPIVEETPCEEVAPAVEETPAVEEAPTAEEIPCEEETPAVAETPAEDIPCEDAPTAETPAEEIPTAEETPAGDTPAESTEETSDKKEPTPEELEKARKKAERKEKTKAWFKKHKLFVIITSVVLAVAIGLTVGHFVTTRNVAFIHTLEDLTKALEKGNRTELLFKEDITVDGDLTLDGYVLDLNGHTLTVDGALTLKGKDGKAFVGNRAYLWTDPEVGGTIACEDLYLSGEHWYVGADLQLTTLTLSGSATLTSVSAEHSALDEGITVRVTDSISGTTQLAPTATLHIFGHADTLRGGVVYAESTSTVDLVTGSRKLYLLPGCAVARYENVESCFFVRQLETPTLVVLELTKGYKLLISEVYEADHFLINFGDLEPVILPVDKGSEYTEYILPEMLPGDYNLSVVAASTNEDAYLKGNAATATVSYYVQLDTPSFLITVENSESGRTYWLDVSPVAHADGFRVWIGNTEISVPAAAEGNTRVDVTEHLSAVGTVDFRVVATSTQGHYTQSQPALDSYVHTDTLATPTGTLVAENSEGTLTLILNLQLDPNAYYVEVVVRGLEDSKYTTQYNVSLLTPNGDGTYTLTLELEDSGNTYQMVTVTCLGTGYYNNSLPLHITIEGQDVIY